MACEWHVLIKQNKDTICQSFTHQILKVTNSPKFYPTTVLRYTVFLISHQGRVETHILSYVTTAQKNKIGKRAAKNSIAASIGYYAWKYPLKETIVRRLKNLYQLELSKSQGNSSDNTTF